MPRFAKRKDVNHNQIEDAFRRMLADHVTDSSGWGGGAGDLFVSYKNYGAFIEIKADEKKELTAAQVRFKALHPGCWWKVTSVEGAIELAQHIRKVGGSL